MICSLAFGRLAYQPNAVLPEPQVAVPCQQTARFVPSTSPLDAFSVRFCACKFDAISVYGEDNPVAKAVAGRLR